MKPDPAPAQVHWQRELRCPAQLGQLPALQDLVRAACRQARASGEAAHDLLLMAEEACVNVMHHAYPDRDDGMLLLRVRVTPRGIELVLQDQGVAFDPLAQPAAAVTADVEHRAIGGLGVHLIRQMADRLDYRRDPQLGNVLVIEKHLPQAG